MIPGLRMPTILTYIPFCRILTMLNKSGKYSIIDALYAADSDFKQRSYFPSVALLLPTLQKLSYQVSEGCASM
jgi:hypothetical protein